MGTWFREWVKVGAAIAFLGSLLWLLAERDVGLPALLRSAAWGLVVWIGCGLIWLGLQYGQGHADARGQWRRRKLLGVVFCVLLVLPGLAACTPAMPVSGKAALPARVEPPPGPWPRELTSGDNTFSIFQPQYDHWEQGRLDGRSAVAVEGLASPEPRYGVIWFTARTEVDKETQLVTLEDLTVSKADFPTVPDGGASYLGALQRAFSEAPLTIARDRLQAELEVEQVEDPGRIVPVKNDPPRIIVSQVPALLVRIDGQPALRAVAGTSLLRVINTRVLLLLDPSAGRYYVWLRNQWLAASKLDGPWAVASNPPSSLEAAKQAAVQGGQVDLLDDAAPDLTPLLQAGSTPTLYVSTTPAELLVLKGQPAFAPVATTGILEVTNTDDDLFLYTPEQAYYVLLSGRWFRAKTLQGPWEFVGGDRLPRDFARIPESNPKGEVLASIPGTPQAREAVIADDIPQTATISRRDAKLTFQYDGPPQLKPIEGTPLQYVVNASVPVIRVDASTYYALQNGVWFVNTAPTGAWTVATSVPPVIYTIPASSPLHYVTYAYVYGSTADVVYTGYAPGYLGTVVAPGPVVVDGTGYAYPDWAGAYWYPGPWGWDPFVLGFGFDGFGGFGFRHHFRDHRFSHGNGFHHHAGFHGGGFHDGGGFHGGVFHHGGGFHGGGVHGGGFHDGGGFHGGGGGFHRGGGGGFHGGGSGGFHGGGGGGFHGGGGGHGGGGHGR
jgi:hypothetical protein